VDHRADTHALLGLRAMRAIDFLLEGSSEPAARATVKFRLANFLGWGTGELDDAERACSEAGALFEQAGDRSSALLAANELAWIRGLRGDYPAMEAPATRVADAAQVSGETFAAIHAAQARGFAALVQGRFREADAVLRSSNEIARQHGKAYRLTVGLLQLACSLAAQGRVEDARTLVDEAKALNPAWRESILPEWEAIVHWFAGGGRVRPGGRERGQRRAEQEAGSRRRLCGPRGC